MLENWVLLLSCYFLEGNKTASLPMAGCCQNSPKFGSKFRTKPYGYLNVIYQQALKNLQNFYFKWITEFSVEFLIFGPFRQQPALVKIRNLFPSRKMLNNSET